MIRGLLFSALLLPLGAFAGRGSAQTVVITARTVGNDQPAPKITLKYHGSLRDVAERIATEGKLNVVVRGDLDEEAEVYFQSVPADEALETLAKAYGLTLERHGAIFTLRPHLDGNPPRMVAPLPPLPPVPPVPPVPAVPPVPPVPPGPQMHGHAGHSHGDEMDDDDDDEDEGDQADATDEEEDSDDAMAQKMGKWKDFLKKHKGNGDDRVSTGDQTVEEDQEVDSVVSYGGSITVKGRVRRQVVAFGGNVHLGPHSVVDGDVVAFGGSVEREPGAKVHGHIQYFGSKDGQGWGAMSPNESKKMTKVTEKRSGWTIPLLFLEFAVCFALGFIFLMFAPKPMRQIELELRNAPLYCGLTGLVGGAGVLALSLLLAVTIILSPFAVILLLVAAVGVAMGFAALASEIGTRLPVLKANRKTQAAVLALGTSVLLITMLIPVLKFLIILTASCLALGATIRTRFGTRPREFPEAV